VCSFIRGFLSTRWRDVLPLPDFAPESTSNRRYPLMRRPFRP
jgi:hypothetical protein